MTTDRQKQHIKNALQRRDVKTVALIADHLRHAHGYDYEMTMDFFARHGGDRDEVEQMFWEADHLESNDDANSAEYLEDGV
jgi:hypothetical protein